MSVTAVYKLYLDVDGDQSYSAEIGARVVYAEWSLGMNEATQVVANPARLRVILDNEDGEFTLDLGGASYNAEVLKSGMWVKLTGTVGAVERTLFIGGLREVTANHERNTVRTVTLLAEDQNLELLDANYVPQILLNKRIDQILRSVLNAALPFNDSERVILLSDGFTLSDGAKLGDLLGIGNNDLMALDQAKTKLLWYGDGLNDVRGVSPLAVIADLVGLEAGGIFYWDGRQGKYRFRNRRYAWEGFQSGIDAVIDDAMIHRAETGYLRGIVNKAVVAYEPRRLGSARDVLYSNEGRVFEIPYGKGYIIVASYSDNSNTNRAQRTLATNTLDPKIGTDIIVNTKKDDSGEEISDKLNFTFEHTEDESRIIIDNLAYFEPVYLTTLRVRGQSLKTYAREVVSAEDSVSIDEHRKHERLYDLPGLGQEALAQGFADSVLHQYAEPAPVWRSVGLTANMNSTTLGIAMQRTIGDTIQIDDDAISQHDETYTIIGERHQIDARRQEHRVQYVLKRYPALAYFQIGTHSIGGNEYIAF